jgi:hypothetical protein
MPDKVQKPSDFYTLLSEPFRFWVTFMCIHLFVKIPSSSSTLVAHERVISCEHNSLYWANWSHSYLNSHTLSDSLYSFISFYITSFYETCQIYRIICWHLVNKQKTTGSHVWVWHIERFSAPPFWTRVTNMVNYMQRLVAKLCDF